PAKGKRNLKEKTHGRELIKLRYQNQPYSRNRSRGYQGSPVRNPHTSKPHHRRSLRESSSGLVKFIVYQMSHEFRRLFVLGFGDADSAQYRKEQRALYWPY